MAIYARKSRNYQNNNRRQSYKRSLNQSNKKGAGMGAPPARGCNHNSPGALMITCNGTQAYKECRDCHMVWRVPQLDHMCDDN
jgi:hypothetical protein